MNKSFEDYLINKDEICIDFKCKNCNGLLIKNFKTKKVLQCRNGHTYCIDCWEKNVNNQCFECDDKYDSISNLSNNLFLFDNFSKTIKISCPNFNETDKIYGNFECKENIKINELETHLKNCQYYIVICENSLNCNQKFYLIDKEKHNEICDYKESKCNFCQKFIIKKEKEQHVNETCPEISKKCPQCDIDIKNKNLPIHIEHICRESYTSCMFDQLDSIRININGYLEKSDFRLPCIQYKRKDESQHFSSCISTHNIILKDVLQTYKNSFFAIQNLVMDLKLKIDVLEKENKEINSNVKLLNSNVESLQKENLQLMQQSHQNINEKTSSTTSCTFGQSSNSNSFFVSNSKNKSLFGDTNPFLYTTSSNGGLFRRIVGTTIPYTHTVANDSNTYESISAMPYYSDRSFEELRLEDISYRKDFVYKTLDLTKTGSMFNQPSSTTTKSLFGQQTSTTNTSLFGQQTSTTTTSLFSQPTSTNTSLFGQPPCTTKTTIGGCLFGQSTSTTTSSLFGQPTSTTTSLFGQPSSTTSLFGQPPISTTSPTTTTSSFGQPSSTATTSLFGQPSSTANTSLFGQPKSTATTSLFGQPPITTLFGGTSTPTTPAPSGGSPFSSSLSPSKSPFGSSFVPSSPFGSSKSPSKSSFGSAFGSSFVPSSSPFDGPSKSPSKSSFGSSPFGSYGIKIKDKNDDVKSEEEDVENDDAQSEEEVENENINLSKILIQNKEFDGTYICKNKKNESPN